MKWNDGKLFCSFFKKWTKILHSFSKKNHDFSNNGFSINVFWSFKREFFSLTGTRNRLISYFNVLCQKSLFWQENWQRSKKKEQIIISVRNVKEGAILKEIFLPKELYNDTTGMFVIRPTLFPWNSGLKETTISHFVWLCYSCSLLCITNWNCSPKRDNS